MDLLKDINVLSLEQATVIPYLTYRLAQDGMNVIRLEHPVYGDPNRMIGENVLGEERMNAYFLCINAGKKALTQKTRPVRLKKVHHLDLSSYVNKVGRPAPRDGHQFGAEIQAQVGGARSVLRQRLRRPGGPPQHRRNQRQPYPALMVFFYIHIDQTPRCRYD